MALTALLRRKRRNVSSGNNQSQNNNDIAGVIEQIEQSLSDIEKLEKALPRDERELEVMRLGGPYGCVVEKLKNIDWSAPLPCVFASVVEAVKFCSVPRSPADYLRIAHALVFALSRVATHAARARDGQPVPSNPEVARLTSLLRSKSAVEVIKEATRYARHDDLKDLDYFARTCLDDPERCVKAEKSYREFLRVVKRFGDAVETYGGTIAPREDLCVRFLCSRTNCNAEEVYLRYFSHIDGAYIGNLDTICLPWQTIALADALRSAEQFARQVIRRRIAELTGGQVGEDGTENSEARCNTDVLRSIKHLWDLVNRVAGYAKLVASNVSGPRNREPNSSTGSNSGADNDENRDLESVGLDRLRARSSKCEDAVRAATRFEYFDRNHLQFAWLPINAVKSSYYSMKFDGPCIEFVNSKIAQEVYNRFFKGYSGILLDGDRICLEGWVLKTVKKCLS